MGNLHEAMTSGNTALDLSFGGFTTTWNPQYEKRKKDLCGYHHPIYFPKLVPEIGLFSKISNKSQ